MGDRAQFLRFIIFCSVFLALSFFCASPGNDRQRGRGLEGLGLRDFHSYSFGLMNLRSDEGVQKLKIAWMTHKKTEMISSSVIVRYIPERSLGKTCGSDAR